MNKDEMIEEMAKTTNFTAFDYRQGTIQSKTIYTAMAEALYNAGYRKVGEDEQIVNTEQLYETLKSVRESGKRVGYAQGRDETVREILHKTKDYIENSVGGYLLIDRKGIRELATELGIDLEG